MSRFLNDGFTKDLSSGLSIVALLAVGYSLNGESQLVYAANGPSPKLAAQSDGRLKASRDDAAAKASDPLIDSIIEEMRQRHRPDVEPAPLKDQRNLLEGEGSAGAPPVEFDDYHATAYCLKGRTASGEYTRRGFIAADPSVLPIGTVVHLQAPGYSGRYRVMDTGRFIRGKKIDVYVPSLREARQFGRQQIKLAVISRPIERRPGRRVVAASM
jgi:3D (Asp-Asp-Asp) domain-containing protein